VVPADKYWPGIFTITQCLQQRSSQFHIAYAKENNSDYNIQGSRNNIQSFHNKSLTGASASTMIKEYLSIDLAL
jgi:hypothetical protein